MKLNSIHGMAENLICFDMTTFYNELSNIRIKCAPTCIDTGFDPIWVCAHTHTPREYEQVLNRSISMIA